jgi:hypothetical protein
MLDKMFRPVMAQRQVRSGLPAPGMLVIQPFLARTNSFSSAYRSLRSATSGLSGIRTSFMARRSHQPAPAPDRHKPSAARAAFRAVSGCREGRRVSSYGVGHAGEVIDRGKLRRPRVAVSLARPDEVVSRFPRNEPETNH